ncbi:MAG: hypothetical protein K2J99_17010 [Lachnospiraceae bacterium]|nr:hypothetical protein [Lachnospiraceae bacterium]
MKERKEKILVVAEMLMSEVFEKSSSEVIQHCEKNGSKIVGGFLKAVENAVRDAANSKKKNSDNQIYYILFSYLHSSIFLQRYLIRIDLMDTGFYKEEPLATSYWDAGDIYNSFEGDIEKIRQMMAEKIPRLRKYETDYIRYAYAPYYHHLAGAFIKEMVGGLLESAEETHHDDKDEKQAKILFGEYMGEAEIFLNVGRRRINAVFQDLCG